jgi:hypothetical protein
MKVTLVAKGMGWRDAPGEGETWSICQHITKTKVTRIIDMNDYSLWGDGEARYDKMSRTRATREGIPYVDLTNYPLQKVVEFFGTDYFSNTVDYALALAIYEGFTEIDLYGVQMEEGSEYAFEKPGVEYWIGRAQGKGIKVTVFGESTIMKTRDGKLYGYGTEQKPPGRE